MSKRVFRMGRLCGFFALCIPLASMADYRPGYRVLSERIEITIHADFTSTRVQTRSIEVLERSAVDYLGESSVSFNSDHVQVDVIEAHVTRPDGSTVAVSPDNIKVKDAYVDEDAPIFSSEKKLYILFPEISVGSVITQKIKKDQHTPTFPGHFYWYDYASPYQPTDSATYTFTYHESIPLKFAVRGGYRALTNGDSTAIPKGYARRSFNYQQTNFRPYEDGSLDLFDYAPMVMASTFSDWRAVAKAYDDRANDMSAVTKSVRALAIRLTEGLTKTEDKIRVLHQWVAQNIRYVGTYIGAGGFVPHSAQSVLNRRYGDCKDHVVLLEALLAAVDIDSTAALVDLGDSYSLGLLPTPSPFNHVITYVPAIDLFIDSTARYARTGTLPSSVMAKRTVLVKTGQVRRTPSPSPIADTEITDVSWELAMNGDMIGKAIFSQTGWFEVWGRNYFSGYESAAKDRWIRKSLESNGEVGDGSQSPPDSDDWGAPWVIATTTDLPGYVNLPQRSAFRIPVGLASGTLSELVATNWPYQRQAPWRCVNRKIVDKFLLLIPPAIKVEHIPDGISVAAGEWEYRSSYKLLDNTIVVTRELSMRFTQPNCTAKLAEPWKRFMSAVRRDVRGQIFLSTKNAH
jgi:transglutaminase-like putative cysteine protease